MTPEPTTEWSLPTRLLGRRTLVYDRLESTNSLALALADAASEGLAIITAEQTGGRGTQGRVWAAPAGSSVLLSVLLFPPERLRRPVLLTAWAAVSVGSLVEKLTGRPWRIKWPNDVFLAGQKVCGILIEQGRGTVVGIGLNVSQPAEWFLATGLVAATSLALHGVTLPSDEVARELLQQLDSEWTALEAGGIEPLESRWKAALEVVNQLVRVETATTSHIGRVLEIGFDGILLAEGGPVPRLLPCETVRQIIRLESAPG